MSPIFFTFFSLSHASFVQSSHLFSLPFWSLCRVPNMANILKRIRKVNKPFCRTPAVVISARAQPFTLQDKFIKVEGRISYSRHFSFFGVVPPSLEARLLLNKLVCLSRGSFNFNRLVNRYETFVRGSTSWLTGGNCKIYELNDTCDGTLIPSIIILNGN